MFLPTATMVAAAVVVVAVVVVVVGGMAQWAAATWTYSTSTPAIPVWVPGFLWVWVHCTSLGPRESPSVSRETLQPQGDQHGFPSVQRSAGVSRRSVLTTAMESPR
ncbi:hypothetical protein E2C01_060237 [Portunus trituberculatus]|uniref:Uncharacterized protein n=1 Tax=Portunus trituberculatus TaxID=210409 RepID=A0A5B7HBH8_PORTR|nr:hypothetical protein [Portunus trituberculatus]